MMFSECYDITHVLIAVSSLQWYKKESEIRLAQVEQWIPMTA